MTDFRLTSPLLVLLPLLLLLRVSLGWLIVTVNGVTLVGREGWRGGRGSGRGRHTEERATSNVVCGQIGQHIFLIKAFVRFGNAGG